MPAITAAPARTKMIRPEPLAFCEPAAEEARTGAAPFATETFAEGAAVAAPAATGIATIEAAANASVTLDNRITYSLCVILEYVRALCHSRMAKARATLKLSTVFFVAFTVSIKLCEGRVDPLALQNSASAAYWRAMGYAKMNRAVLLIALVAIRAPATEPIDAAGDPIVRSLAAQDAILATVGTRIAVAAAPLCASGGYASGLILQAVSQYAPPYRSAADRVLGLRDYPGVTFVVPGGAADRAGLKQGDAVVAIDSRPTTLRRPSASLATMADTIDALDLLDAGLRDGSAELDVIREDASTGEPLRIRLRGAPACAARFEVRPGDSGNASADGRTIQVSSDLVDPNRADSEFAPLIAHEMSHIILRHAESLRRHQGGFLPGFGKGGAALRASEIAADRLSVYLLAMAEYPARDAIAFWARFGREKDMGLFSDRTHPGWKTRVEAIRTEVERVEAQQSAGRPITPPADLNLPKYR